MMMELGLQKRAVTGHNGVHNIHFLKSATKEVVRTAQSTYFKAAAFLSDPVKNDAMYVIKGPQTHRPVHCQVIDFKTHD